VFPQISKGFPKWELLEPKAVQVFQRDLDLTVTFYEFDHSLHRHIRTTNHLERLFRRHTFAPPFLSR